MSNTSLCHRFRPTQLIAPTVLVGLGVAGIESDWMKRENRKIRDGLQKNGGHKIPVDDYLQYVPAGTVYGLDLFGIKGRHDVLSQIVVLGTAYVLMGVTVSSLKAITKVKRPDGSSLNSFPSGHTATAFMGAEFLRREYAEVSPWIGVAGYAVAAGTGFLRMYNNRHWLTDVVAGAGVGILSVEAAYWLYPLMTKTLFPKRHPTKVSFMPYGSSQVGGLECRIVF